MRRHPGLQPLSRDHHLGLVQARRLRRAAEDDPAARVEAGRAFLHFFETETLAHFHEEEELVFPLLEPPPDSVVQALVEHVRVHGLVGRLRRALAQGSVDPSLLRKLGELLDGHIRLEERQLFPLIEQRVPEADLAALDLRDRRGCAVTSDSPVVDLDGTPEGRGPLWGTATEDLNVTLLAWNAGEGTPEHVNAERDVLVVVLAGSGTARVDGADHPLRGSQALVIPKASSRSITAGADGIRYLTAHLRKPGLQIERLASM